MRQGARVADVPLHCQVGPIRYQNVHEHSADAEYTALVASLMPHECVVSAGRDDSPAEPLFPEEEAVIAGALSHRQREFALGRTHARRALRTLGLAPAPIGARADRAPLWPEGVVGAITHTTGFVAAAVARSGEVGGIGLDVETRIRVLRTGIERFILTPNERATLTDALPPHLDPLRLAFSAKEAVHKCISPPSGITLGFHDVELDFSHHDGVFSVRLVGRPDPRLPDFRRLAGTFAVTEDYVAASVIVTTPGAPAPRSKYGRAGCGANATHQPRTLAAR